MMTKKKSRFVTFFCKTIYTIEKLLLLLRRLTAATMNYSELKKRLKAGGCYFVENKSNHEWWYSPITGRHFPIQRHTKMDIGAWLLKEITKQSGIKL